MTEFTNKPLEGVGIGLRHEHFKDFLDPKPEDKPNVPWLEIHTENFFSSGSTATQYLLEIREDYPLSCHCVGLSLGSADKVNARHLQNVKEAVERFQPKLISDHLSWSGIQGDVLPDLLPVPYTDECLSQTINNITQVQETLGRQILIENPSSYITFADSYIHEAEFLVEVARQAGCGLLLDINNIFVTAHNHKLDAEEYLDTIPTDLVQEIHLAGFSIDTETDVYIDDHGAPVHDPVWKLYALAKKRFTNVPTCIEWDSNIPPLSALMAEKRKAEAI